jgi:hypothetical protein
MDTPPGHRGYGKAEWIALETPIDDYNASVAAAQGAEGRIASGDAPGS